VADAGFGVGLVWFAAIQQGLADGRFHLCAILLLTLFWIDYFYARSPSLRWVEAPESNAVWLLTGVYFGGRDGLVAARQHWRGLAAGTGRTRRRRSVQRCGAFEFTPRPCHGSPSLPTVEFKR